VVLVFLPVSNCTLQSEKMLGYIILFITFILACLGAAYKCVKEDTRGKPLYNPFGLPRLTKPGKWIFFLLSLSFIASVWMQVRSIEESAHLMQQLDSVYSDTERERTKVRDVSLEFHVSIPVQGHCFIQYAKQASIGHIRPQSRGLFDAPFQITNPDKLPLSKDRREVVRAVLGGFQFAGYLYKGSSQKAATLKQILTEIDNKRAGSREDVPELQDKLFSEVDLPRKAMHLAERDLDWEFDFARGGLDPNSYIIPGRERLTVVTASDLPEKQFFMADGHRLSTTDLSGGMLTLLVKLSPRRVSTDEYYADWIQLLKIDMRINSRSFYFVADPQYESSESSNCRAVISLNVDNSLPTAFCLAQIPALTDDVSRLHDGGSQGQWIPSATRFAPWIALFVSLAALLLSAVQYWRTEWSPFRLIVMPPVVTQVNDELPSLIIDMVLSNNGAHQAVISDLIIHLLSNGNDTGIALHAQNILNRDTPLGTLPLVSNQTSSAVFLPILVGRNETKAFRICCTPWQSELPLSEISILQTNQIKIDLLVNGKLRPGVFVLGYTDYRDKFKGNGIVDIPPKGWPPRWYTTESAVVLYSRGFQHAW
jgi:hypothetical protein